MKKTLLFLLFISVINNSVKAQEAGLSKRDVDYIKFVGSELITEYQLLLQVISEGNMNPFEQEQLIKNAYGASSNQLFENEFSVIEYDLDPLTLEAQKPRNITISRYLRDFSLLLENGEQAVTFENIESTEIKKGEYYYYQINFDKQIQIKHKNYLKVDFPSVSRTAEIKAVKSGSKWNVYISSIIFTKEVPIQLSQKFLAQIKETKEDIKQEKALAATKVPKVSSQFSRKEIQRKKYKKHGRVALFSTLGFATVSGVLAIAANNKFEEAKNATTRSQGEALLQQTQTLDRIWIGTSAVSGLGLVWYLNRKNKVSKL